MLSTEVESMIGAGDPVILLLWPHMVLAGFADSFPADDAFNLFW